MTDEQLLDAVKGLSEMSDAEMTRLAQLLIDQADYSRRTQDDVARMLLVEPLPTLRFQVSR